MNRNRLSAEILEEFERMFIDGRIRAGDKLPAERTLCKRFSVSRTVLREAIRTLEERRLVNVRPGSGIFVVPRPRDSITESLEFLVRLEEISFANLIEARYNLEMWVVRLAADRRTKEDLQALETQLLRMKQGIVDVSDFLEADQEFHMQLAVSTRNPLYCLWIKPIIHSISTTRRGIATLGSIRKEIVECHQDIFDAVKKKDTFLARRAMRKHLVQVVTATQIAIDMGILKREDFTALKWLLRKLGRKEIDLDKQGNLVFDDRV